MGKILPFSPDFIKGIGPFKGLWAVSFLPAVGIGTGSAATVGHFPSLPSHKERGDKAA
jgi:hypothetical protein